MDYVFVNGVMTMKPFTGTPQEGDGGYGKRMLRGLEKHHEISGQKPHNKEEKEKLLLNATMALMLICILRRPMRRPSTVVLRPAYGRPWPTRGCQQG